MKNLNSFSNETRGVSSLSTKGKIGFFSVILISINSTIGSGIFFKTDSVMSYTDGSVLFIVLSWLVSAFSILCLALAVCELSSVCTGNLGITGWCRKFSTKYVYSASKNFLVYVYAPVMCFFTPIFVVKYFQFFLASVGIQNNFGTGHDWLIWSIICFSIITWFFLTSGVSNRVANWQNSVIAAVKLIPIFTTIIVGLFILVKGENQPVKFLPDKFYYASAVDMFKLTPFLGLFGSLSSIVFTYGGFYSITSIRTKMKNPEKNGTAIIVSIIVISIIYFTIAMVMTFSYSGNGLFYSFFQNNPKARWIRSILYLTISIGILGIVNGVVIFGVNLTKTLIENGEIIVPCCLLHRSSRIRGMYGLGFLFTIYILFFVPLSVIGGICYFPDGGPILSDAPGYDSMARLINFANLIGSWIIIFTFVFICTAVFGALRNRQKFGLMRRRFLWAGWTAVGMVVICSFFLVLQPIVDIVLILCNHTGNKFSQLLGNALLIVLLVLFLSISVVPVLFEKRIFIGRKKFLENMLMLTERLSVDHINEFASKDHLLKISFLNELGIDDKDICHSLANYRWKWLFNNDENRQNFNLALQQNILKINGILEL